MLKGFTLIELLVVVSIVGALSAIAIPYYQHHLISVRRNEAKAGLMLLANKLSLYYRAHHSYSGATLAKLKMSQFSKGGYYQFSISQLSAYNYQLMAAEIRTEITSRPSRQYDKIILNQNNFNDIFKHK